MLNAWDRDDNGSMRKKMDKRKEDYRWMLRSNE